MKTTIFITVLAMLAMVNAVPVQEDKNLQGLLDVLANQKTNKDSAVQAVDENQPEAEAQVLHKILKFLWANKQQDDDGNQAEAQFLHKILSLYANKQQDNDNGDQADAQFWGALGRLAIKHLAPHAINYLGEKLG